MARTVPLLVWSLLLLSACAAQKELRAELPRMALYQEEAPPSSPPVLTQNHFTRDQGGGLTEAALRQILAAPVFLEEHARVGVVPVRTAYAPDMEVPLPGVPAALAGALEATGHFELTCEVSTDFPADRGISGLRELAARYRADYLLLYRQRFVERAYPNPVAALWFTGLGAFFAPGRTQEAAGVLEATLFDVKTGTLLFTVNERVGGQQRVTPIQSGIKAERLQRRLLEEASGRLAEQVTDKVRRLVAARPERKADALLSSTAMPAQLELHAEVAQ